MGSGNGTAFEHAEYEKKNGAAHGVEPPKGKKTMLFFYLSYINNSIIICSKKKKTSCFRYFKNYLERIKLAARLSLRTSEPAHFINCCCLPSSHLYLVLHNHVSFNTTLAYCRHYYDKACLVKTNNNCCYRDSKWKKKCLN